ncbi:MAG: acyl-CoA dehydrogenase family protein [Acidimicrobiia bacterium]|nr:acyl-CoA dehydrogenase family protein [Acidimicrobiia bacterium]
MTALDTARQFARDVIDAGAADWERDRRLPREALGAAAQVGLCGLLVPGEQGGAGLGVAGMADVLGVLAAADMGFAFSLVCHNNLVGAIAKRGTAAQRARYVAPMVDGSLVGAFLLTEPGVGSDATAITTTARRDGDGWVLDGHKAWATNGTEADVMNVYVQTEPGSGARGIAAFLVDADQPGVVRGEAYEMLGAHSTGTASFAFDGVRLSADQLFIEPGAAFGAAMEAIDIARIVVSAMCAGMLRRGLETAVDYVAGREAFGQPLAAQQGLRWMLADVATDLEAAVALTDRASAALDAGAADLGVKAAHAKKFATRVAMDGLSQCMQALGANGFRQDRPLARHLAGAKMAQYLDGTTEIQNVVIARSLFGR